MKMDYSTFQSIISLMCPKHLRDLNQGSVCENFIAEEETNDWQIT